MAPSPDQFAYWLTQAVLLIKAKEQKNLSIIQDELAFALGRQSGEATIGYWRKGNIPADWAVIEKLAVLLAQRGGFSRHSCEQFLRSAGHSRPEAIVQQLFPQTDPTDSPNRSAAVMRKLHPFVTHQPVVDPRQFFGRVRECRRIFAWWRHFPLQNVAIVGPKKSGRTSLLHYLKEIHMTPAGRLRPNQRNDWLPDAARYHWLYVDFFDARWRKREALLRYLLAEMGLPLPDPCTLDTFMETVSDHLHQPAVIMLDELSAGLEMPDYDLNFWRSMRALVTSVTRGNLAFVITALDAPGRLAANYGKTSPFFNLFASVTLGPLTIEEATELIASSPRPFAAADVQWILEQSQGWPVVVQRLCQERLLALEDGRTDDEWRVEALARIEPYHYLLQSPGDEPSPGDKPPG